MEDANPASAPADPVPADAPPAVEPERIPDPYRDKPEIEEPDPQTVRSSDEEGDEDEADDDEPKGDEPPKKLSRYQRMKRERDQAVARAEAAERARAEAAPSEARKPEPVPASAIEAEIGPPPKEADFGDDWLAFERAQTAYEAEKRLTERQFRQEAARRQAARTDELSRLANDFAAKTETVRASLPDWDDVMGSAPPAPSLALEMIVRSEAGPQLAYALAKDAALVRRLHGMDPLSVAREMGRLEERVLKSQPSPRAVTKAPPPSGTLRGGSSGAPDLASLDMASYIAARNRGVGN